jgi:hypothetical protein
MEVVLNVHSSNGFAPLSIGVTAAVFHIVDIDSKDAISLLMALGDFVVDVRALCRFCSDENYRNGSAIQLIIDPLVDRILAFFLHLFPFRCIPEPRRLAISREPTVANLSRTPNITLK